MTDSNLPATPDDGAVPAGQAEASAVTAQHEEKRERVALGLLAASGAVVLGGVLTVVIWRAGYVASLTSFLLAAGAIFLYGAVAGRPRKGLIPLIALVVVGVVASFFAVVASDAWEAYDAFVKGQFDVGRAEFIRETVTDPEILSAYGKDMAMFGLFAVLGIFTTLRRLVSSR